jgi:hypothetical protein
MATRKLDDWLKSFLEYASFGEAPYKMLFWTGVSTIAGALRRQVWIDMKYFQWVPNFYIIMVAPPGIVSKSTTASIGMNLLKQIKDVKFGPDVVTWQALVQSLGESTRLVLDKSTGEYLPMSCVTISSSEFGTFLNPQDREMVDVLVSLWDGQKGAFSKVTKSSGNDLIENPWINIIACTTPAWISGNFPEYMIGGGFTSRCVFVYTDRKRQEIAYPDEHVPEHFKAIQQDLIHDLEIISQLVGEYKLSPEAREWGTAWYTKHWQNPPAGLSTDQFGGYLARKQTHIHKLAMVVAAARSDDLVITQDALETAETFVSALEKDMPRVFARIGQTDITKGAYDLLEIVRKARRIPMQDAYQRLFRNLSYRDFEEASKSAVNAGHIKMEQQGNTIMLVSLQAPEVSE